MNEHPSLVPAMTQGKAAREPTWWGIVVAFCSFVAAIAIVAIARGWL